MRKLSYPTGRNYGKAQVLEIQVTKIKRDDYGIVDVSATFVDAARGIRGHLETVCFSFDVLSDKDIGEAVLATYDAGKYSLA